MAVKKDADKEKKVVQIKATTGAWWKSTTDSLQDEATESPVTQKETGTKEKSGGVSTAKPSQKKPSPRRGRTPKKTDSPIEKEKSVPSFVVT